ncbi:MAG: 2-oxoacid:acceptor oxidoreductase subunit alpha [Thermoprotei archaeon]|nr:MAG: 2-oxoacid:acceptor oxidoreductase subunit alpha [Thermoprotei archaeon]
MDISIIIGGEAGAGVMRSGYILARALVRGGLSVFGTNDYPSLIRGGHNAYMIHASDKRIHAHRENFDIVVALNAETITRYVDQLTENAAIIYDPKDRSYAEKLSDKALLVEIPMMDIVKEEKAKPVMMNSVAIGAAAGLTEYDYEILKSSILDSFPKPEVGEINARLAKRGYDIALEEYSSKFKIKVAPLEKDGKQIYLTGNEAVALGAMQAGMKFYAAYPMTPASPILHFLALHGPKYGIVVVQPESEIAAINMVIGAAYAGVRAMTATSGGGFSLMTEALGLAAMSETPIVVAIAQRVGPSTGMPTYTAQTDLMFVLNASQGEFPRFVIAPGDVKECFYRTIEAFNLAEKFQVPAIILIDKYLAESHMSTEIFDTSNIKIDRGELITGEYKGKEYRRYEVTETGVSPRAIPSTRNAIVKANSSEHTEYGYASSNALNAVKMQEKRFRKLKYMIMEMDKLNPAIYYGDPQAELVLIGWGSIKCPVLDALEILKSMDISVGFLHFIYLSPFPVKYALKYLKDRKIMLVENTYTGQLANLLKMHTGLTVDYKVLRYDGRPINPSQIVEKVFEVIR